MDDVSRQKLAILKAMSGVLDAGAAGTAIVTCMYTFRRFSPLLT